MGQETGISWTAHTFNPWWGCVKVSPGCDHCYADAQATRYGYSDGGAHFPIWGKDATRRFFGDNHWAEPLKWDRAAAKDGVTRRVFCASMADVMEDRRVLDVPRDRLYRLIDATPNLIWQLLTKRPQNYRKLLPAKWLVQPHPRVWMGTTVEAQQYDWRIKELLTTPAEMRFVSYEPALGPVNFRRIEHHPSGCGGPVFIDSLAGTFCSVGSNGNIPYVGLDWIIVGGESGPHARPFDIQWARDTIRQCREAGVACFMKQLGAKPFDHSGSAWVERWEKPKNRAGADPSEWPKEFRVQEFPQ